MTDQSNEKEWHDEFSVQSMSGKPIAYPLVANHRQLPPVKRIKARRPKQLPGHGWGLSDFVEGSGDGSPP